MSYSDIPKSLMLLKGQDPYLVDAWSSPYPPFLLMVLGGIMWVAAGGRVPSGSNVGLFSWEIRMAGLLADLSVAILIFLVLRLRGLSGLQVFVPVGVYLLLDPIALSPYLSFHADIFGYLILASSLLALVSNRLLTGTVLLAVSAVFKVHPILALLLLLFWMVKRYGIVRALPGLVSSGTILVLGLVLPFWIPGYADSFLGYNLSTGFGGGTASFSLMNLFYGVLPAAFGLAFPISTINMVWLTATAALFIFALGWIWTGAGDLGPVEVVLLGLLVWLLPLRQLYLWYVGWAVVPFLMMGRPVGSLVGGGLLELAYGMAGWSFNLPGNPFPMMASVYGFFLTSLVYAFFNILAMGLALKSSPSRPFVSAGPSATPSNLSSLNSSG